MSVVEKRIWYAARGVGANRYSTSVTGSYELLEGKIQGVGIDHGPQSSRSNLATRGLEAEDSVSSRSFASHALKFDIVELEPWDYGFHLTKTLVASMLA